MENWFKDALKPKEGYTTCFMCMNPENLVLNSKHMKYFLHNQEWRLI